MSKDSIVSPNKSNDICGSQYSHKSLPWPLFSWNDMMCPRCVFTKLWKCKKTCFCEHGNWGLRIKSVFLPCECWVVAASTLIERHWLIFLFTIITTLVNYLSFLKATGYLTLFAGESSDRTVQLIRVTTGMVVNITEYSFLTSFLMGWYSVS